jgi:hypothetical protein
MRVPVASNTQRNSRSLAPTNAHQVEHNRPNPTVSGVVKAAPARLAKFCLKI